MLVSNMQKAIGEAVFFIPEFELWAFKVASVIFD